MQSLRRLALVGAVGLGAAVFASPTFAARPAGLTYTLGSTHFLVHYQTDPTTDFAITQTMAGDTAAFAERAYAAYLADGYSAPPSDGGLGGDNRIDIYVVDKDWVWTDSGNPPFPSPAPTPSTTILGEGHPDTANPQTSGYILLNGAVPDAALDQHTVASVVFELFELGIWQSAFVSDSWLYAGAAEWMAYRVEGYPTPVAVGPDDMALDCRDPLIYHVQCDFDLYRDNGYSRWPFFEYLSEKYGPAFIKDAFAQGAAGAATATAALSNALVAKGTTLADAYDDWSTIQMTGGYTVAALTGLKPTPYAIAQTGASGGSLPDQKVAVNHLSTRYVELQRGNGDPTAPCYTATLTLTVLMPPGTSSKPTFFWDVAGGAPVALTISGNTATASLTTWDTCTWSGTEGFLSLPNASTTVDAADFTVKVSLTTDKKTPATATPPPAPVNVTTPVVPADGDIAPVISVFGPELLTVSPSNPQLRLIVQSNNLGTLKAAVGSVALGTAPLRPGGNDLRFTIPKSLLDSLRRSAGANVLTLTPVSPSGTVTGTPVTRSISIEPAPAAAPKAKPKPFVKTKLHKKHK